jgi:hypothetical protein
MSVLNELRVPDLINPAATVAMLNSTGVPAGTAAGVEGLLTELAEHTAATSPDAAAQRFLAADHDDPLARWCSFVAAHLYDGDAPDTLPRPPWTIPTAARGRPLTALEQSLCRLAINRWDSRNGAVAPGQYALAEASATSGELVRLPIDSVTVAGLATVQLPGGRDQLPRRVILDHWGTPVILRRLEALPMADTTRPLLYEGAAPGTNKAQASASGNLSRVLRVAGLGDDPTLNPTSVRNACAARLFEAGARLEDIAAATGAKSLDRVWRLVTTPAPR